MPSDLAEKVRLVLTSPSKTCLELSREMDKSHIWVRRVREGQVWAHILPDLPRSEVWHDPAPPHVIALVRDALTSTDPAPAVAERHGYHRSVPYKIRTGARYATVCPELPRPGKGTPRSAPRRPTTCHECRLADANGRCTIGVPETKRRGVKAAPSCPSFFQK